jgi:hypothetical protein
MFDEAFTVPVPVAVAEARLVERLKLDGLTRESVASIEEGSAVLERAGFAGLRKKVTVHSIPPYTRNRTIVIAIRWSVAGPFGRLLPTLDGNIELTPGPEDGTTRAVLIGSYRPPFGELGEAIDRALLHAVALATVRGFLSRLTAAIDPPRNRLDTVTGLADLAED